MVCLQQPASLMGGKVREVGEGKVRGDNWQRQGAQKTIRKHNEANVDREVHRKQNRREVETGQPGKAKIEGQKTNQATP